MTPPTYQSCTECRHVQYFARVLCVACGSKSLAECTSAGQGRIAAITILHRAPTDTYRDSVPYAIALVDMDENFRLMSHAPLEAALGERVTVGAGGNGLLMAEPLQENPR